MDNSGTALDSGKQRGLERIFGRARKVSPTLRTFTLLLRSEVPRRLTRVEFRRLTDEGNAGVAGKEMRGAKNESKNHGRDRKRFSANCRFHDSKKLGAKS